MRGDNCFFAATGITDGELLQGVRYHELGATTQSLVMRSKSGTVRKVDAVHRLDKLAEFSSISFTRDDAGAPAPHEPAAAPSSPRTPAPAATASRNSARASAALRLVQLEVASSRRPRRGRRPACRSLTRWVACVTRLLGARHVDLVGQLGDAGQHGDARRGRGADRRPRPGRGRARARVDLEEAAVHAEAPVSRPPLHPDHARDDVTDERVCPSSTVRSPSEVPRTTGGRRREERRLGRDEFDAEDAVGH